MGKRTKPDALDWVVGIGTALTPSWRPRLPLEEGENMTDSDGMLTVTADTLLTVNSGLSLETRLPERVVRDSDDAYLLFSYLGVSTRTGRPKIECAYVSAQSHNPVACT